MSNISKTKIYMACEHYAVLQQDGKTYICEHCHQQPGSSDEPLECKAKREAREPLKNDYWMNINDYDENGNDTKR